jgi:hypothetical protein
VKVVLNGQILYNETTSTLAGISFPGNKAQFIQNLYLGKYDGTSASNLEAFQVLLAANLLKLTLRFTKLKDERIKQTHFETKVNLRSFNSILRSNIQQTNYKSNFVG